MVVNSGLPGPMPRRVDGFSQPSVRLSLLLCSYPGRSTHMNEVRKYFADAFRHLGGNRGLPAIEVRFYPYAGLRHTIRLRSGRVYVRLPDICKDAPAEALRALAWI